MNLNFRNLDTLSRMTALVISAAMITTLGAGCATQSSSGSVYRSSDTQREQTVRMATVEAVRSVTIQRDSKGIGVVGGAVVGGIAGSGASSGKREQQIGTVLGAIAGTVAGQMLEEKANQREGLEITLKYDSGETRIIVQEADVNMPIKAGDRVRVISGGGVLRVAK